MKVVNEYPPNYLEIKQYFDLDGFKPVFAYGGTIYNPHGHEIPADLELHESVHARQQEAYTTPDLWWTKYCIDKDFRLQEEVEAYAYQWRFVRKHIPQAAREALEDFAQTLASGMYDLGLTHHQAHTHIRLKAKELTDEEEK